MVACADADSLESFLFYIHTDYICVSQNFCFWNNWASFCLPWNTVFIVSLMSLIISVKVLLSENATSY